MLKFTPQQEALVLNQRRLHEHQHEVMAAMNSVNGVTLIGNASPLPKDVWGEWDKEAVELQRTTLAVFNDLAAAVSTPIPIGKLVHYFQTVSDSGEVNVSLDGRSKAKTDQPVIAYHGTPLPIIDSSFGFGWRQVAAAQTEGVTLDPAARANALFKITNQLETIALDGIPAIQVGSDKLYGLRTHPKRLTRATGVVLNGATGAQWLAEVTATLKLLHAKNFKTKATLYVNWDDWFYAQNTDYSTSHGNKTIAQRLLESGGISEVVPADSLAAKEIIAVVKDRRVVSVLNGMPVTTRALFRANPEDEYEFTTMAAAAVEIKFDADDNIGLAHSS
jgi:hypothetical protein